MLGFLVYNIYVVIRDQVFQQSVDIRMGTNCAPLLADSILYSYEADFVQKQLRDNNKQEQRKHGIIRPSILVKNNKSIPLKSEREL
jgi:hypothetical protein